ncbi:unnamed protein product [Nesidiocoris tenuis]|uniref:Uncharacterized protein n=1 Tax=Nesidiocoris tenuis TaxID=355587 RepID=A0A6H5HUZ8_9HEMI|nr:unnamed protein product [Nesidiocoris tenuis]
MANGTLSRFSRSEYRRDGRAARKFEFWAELVLLRGMRTWRPVQSARRCHLYRRR